MTDLQKFIKKFPKEQNKNKVKKQLANLLKKVRAEENITQKQLSNLSGICRTVITRIECDSGTKLPRLDLYSKLLSSIGYSTYILVRKRNKIFEEKL